MESRSSSHSSTSHLPSSGTLRNAFLLLCLALVPGTRAQASSAEISNPSVAAAGDDFESSEELRLHLPDAAQEFWTTSLNWVDLVPSRVSAPREEPVPVRVAPTSKVFKIAIDMGHGGRDLGAQGLYDVSEKLLCLQIGRYVKKGLERLRDTRALPIEIRMTRETDDYLTLAERVKVANEWGADVFVSVHANASEYRRARGFEVYFLSARGTDSKARRLASVENGEDLGDAPIKGPVLSMLLDAQNATRMEQSSRLAEIVFQTMLQRLHANGRGVRQAPFYVLAGTTMPAVLIEVGYVTNRTDAKLLAKPHYLKRLANAISTGIIEFAGARPVSGANSRR